MTINYSKLQTDYWYRKKFYLSKEWRSLREVKLDKNPICERCAIDGWCIPATEVHHKIDIKKDPYLCLKIDNLESLCKSCHSTHTAKTSTKKKVGGSIINKLYNTTLE